MPLKYESIVNGPFQENCFLVWNDESKKGVFIDPGDEARRLIRTAQFLGIEIEAIFNTHGHIDHTGAVAEIKKQLEIPFALHPADRFLLDGMPAQARMFGLGELEIPTVDREIVGGQSVSMAGYDAKVIHTPGHTPGGVCFLFDGFVVVGDTLFAGSIGRTDLPGGSYEELIRSIKEGLLVLDDSLKVLTGHGPATTIGVERQHNPFLTGRF